jgi:hypothetical protein
MEWISVNDRLPEKNMRCMIYGRYTKDCPMDVMEGMYFKKQMRFMSNMIYSKNVTHWMPLPEPPKTK